MSSRGRNGGEGNARERGGAPQKTILWQILTRLRAKRGAIRAIRHRTQIKALMAIFKAHHVAPLEALFDRNRVKICQKAAFYSPKRFPHPLPLRSRELMRTGGPYAGTTGGEKKGGGWRDAIPPAKSSKTGGLSWSDVTPSRTMRRCWRLRGRSSPGCRTRCPAC